MQVGVQKFTSTAPMKLVRSTRCRPLMAFASQGLEFYPCACELGDETFITAMDDFSQSVIGSLIPISLQVHTQSKFHVGP